MNLALLFGMAFAGSLHCAGMCGPLALLSGRRFALYVLGKTSTYVFLGAVAGALGHTVSAALGARVLFLGAGAMLLAAALDALGVLRWTAPSRVFALVARNGGALLLGAANGLVPCPLTLAFVAVAAGTASPISGAGVMVVLGLVSAAPLAACAFAGWRLRRFPAVSGAVMVAVAAVMLWRGFAAAGCH
jgi:sulfite exporter TauE/SafE